MTPAQSDAAWLAAWAARNGLAEPSLADTEAFAERVAIKLAELPVPPTMEHRDSQEVYARKQAAQEWVDRHGL